MAEAFHGEICADDTGVDAPTQLKREVMWQRKLQTEVKMLSTPQLRWEQTLPK
jgi:hypothetical protein